MESLLWLALKGPSLVLGPSFLQPYRSSFSTPVGLVSSRPFFVTPKGAVISKSSTTQFFKALLAAHDIPTALELPDLLTVSALDYMHFNNQLSFIGVTCNTSNESVRWILDANAAGTDRVAVVRDCFDRIAPRTSLVRPI